MKKTKNKTILIIIIFSLGFLFSSCLGIDFDISLNSNGSGILTLEYRVSKHLDSLGRLDGNERWNTIPTGRADIERTMDRLPEMKLLSYSSSEDEKDIISNARIEFETIQALLSFLDTIGARSVYRGNPNSGSLELTLSEGRDNINSSLSRLTTEVFSSYMVNMRMNFPNGRNSSFSFPINDILSSPDRVTVEFNW